VMPIRPDQETDLRIVVTNRVDPGQKERIAEDLGDEVSRVFQGGYTTGGTGLGLRICADVVCDGYSLSSVQSALERGYLGARVMGDHFVAWFHWPARRTAPAAA
jgi:signal transduction histidine kinase